jgi:hypothetical protein
VAGSAAPFHSIEDAGKKFEPFRVRINPEVPAITEDGPRDLSEGTALDVALIMNSAEPESPPPGAGLITLTAAVPELAISDAFICTCS